VLEPCAATTTGAGTTFGSVSVPTSRQPSAAENEMSSTKRAMLIRADSRFPVSRSSAGQMREEPPG
jgi:hypothetical protein